MSEDRTEKISFIGNQTRLFAWASRHKLPTVSDSQITAAIQKIVRTDPNATYGEVIQFVKEAPSKEAETGTPNEPWSDLANLLDWAAIAQEEQAKGEVADAAQIVKAALEGGIIEAKDIGLYRRPPPELARRERKKYEEQLEAYEKRLKELEKRLAEAQKISVPKPLFGVGQKVKHPTLGEVEVTDLELANHDRWLYTIKASDGKEYIAEAKELQAIGPPPKPVLLTPQFITELQNLAESLLRDEGLSYEDAHAFVQQKWPELRPELEVARNQTDAREIVKALLPSYFAEARRTRGEPLPQVGPSVQTFIRPGPRPGEISIVGRDYYTDKLIAKIEQRLGHPLSVQERAVLQLPVFQALEKNSHWFSEPMRREEQGYPRDLMALIRGMMERGMLTEYDLRSAGIRF